MRRLVKSIGVFAILAAAAAGISQVAAHHSTSMFDMQQMEVVKGKVVQLRWVNPHVTLIVRGARKSGEAPVEWLMETTSPGNLTRIGNWHRDAVKPGEDIEVVFHPLREQGRRVGLLVQATTPSNGQIYATNIRHLERAGLE